MSTTNFTAEQEIFKTYVRAEHDVRDWAKHRNDWTYDKVQSTLEQMNGWAIAYQAITKEDTLVKRYNDLCPEIEYVHKARNERDVNDAWECAKFVATTVVVVSVASLIATAVAGFFGDND